MTAGSRAEVPGAERRGDETGPATGPRRHRWPGATAGVEPRARRVDERRNRRGAGRRTKGRRTKGRQMRQDRSPAPRHRTTGSRRGPIPCALQRARRWEVLRRRPAGDDGSRDRGRRGDRRPSDPVAPGIPVTATTWTFVALRQISHVAAPPRTRSATKRRDTNSAAGQRFRVPRGTDAGTPSIAASPHRPVSWVWCAPRCGIVTTWRA